MAEALQLLFDPDADDRVRDLWRRLEDASVPSLARHTHGKHRPHVTLAQAKTIPAKAREAVRAELALLSIPDLWLSTLGTVGGEDPALLLGAVVDTELLAVHSAVHDALAGKVNSPSAYFLPNAWMPQCVLAKGITSEQVAAGFAALQPPKPVRAKISQVVVTDTRTGELTHSFP